mgnify:CR=1 FL=1
MKALFVGLGGVGQRHLRNLKAIVGDNLDVSAYRTRGLTKEISNTLEVDDKVDINSQYGIRVFDDLDAALNDGPDAVFICNPTRPGCMIRSPFEPPDRRTGGQTVPRGLRSIHKATTGEKAFK